MKNKLFILFCFLIIKSAFSQDTFTYKTVNASNTKDRVVQLEEPEDGITVTSSKSLGTTSREGGTVTNGTLGALSVSPTGGANYTIPIDVPPGLNGVAPKIALTYNSKSGNGTAGWGWNLSGISSITRIPSTQYHDNKIDPVDFDLLDRFALDGQRLILKTGTYGANGAVYQTEKYSNIKIVSYGTHPTSGVQGPQYFKVFYPDGSIAHYGYNDDSRSPVDYAISYWENPQGIRVNYSYVKDTINSLNISRITYGSRGTATPINEIEFLYGFKRRNEISYINCLRFERTKKLTSIKVKANGVSNRNYTLGYLFNGKSTTSLGYDRLMYVREYTGDNSLYRNNVSFTYGRSVPFGTNQIEESENTFNELNLMNIDQRNAKVVSLDISGDGKLDFIVYPTLGTNTKKKFWLFSDFHFGGFNWGTEVDTGLFEDVFPVSWLNNQNKLLANQGLVVIQNHVGPTYLVKFKTLSSGTIHPIALKYEKTWAAPSYFQNGNLKRIPLKYVSGDFDGDGLSDVIALEKDYIYANNKTKAHLIKLDRRIIYDFSFYLGDLTSQLQSTDKLLTMDVNGDGKTDVLQFREGLVYIYSLDETNTSLQKIGETHNVNIKMANPIFKGDYNGDGKSDFMIPHDFGNNYFMTFLSIGNDFKISPYARALPFSYNVSGYDAHGTLHGYNLLPIDINGDGKTDIIDYKTTTYSNNTSDGEQIIKLYKNIGPDFHDFHFKYGGQITKTGNLKTLPIPVFINSDKPNNNLEFASISDKWVTSFEFNEDHKKDVLLEKIVNNGITTEIKYDQVNPYYQDPNNPFYYSSYTQSYSQTFPYVNVNVAPGFKIVRELTETGDNSTRTKQFFYKGAVSHTSGLGFIGFEELKRTNWYGDGAEKLWSISKHNPMLRNAVTEHTISESYFPSSGQYISKTNYFYDYKLIANPASPSAPSYTNNIIRSSPISGQQTDRAEQSITLKPGFHASGTNGTYLAKIIPPDQQPGSSGYAGVSDLQLKKIENNNGLTGVFTTKTYTYDSYKNPINTHKTYPGGSHTLTQEYSNNAGATNNTYHIGRPTKLRSSNTLNGNTFSSEKHYSYNNNLLIQTKTKGYDTSWLTTDFSHDLNGNVTQKAISADGVASRSEQFEYTGYGERFLTKHINSEGLETAFTYDANTGSLLGITNPYNLVTSFEYDKWDRLEKETDYLGNETLHAYLPQTGGGLKKTTLYATGARDETLYNAFGWMMKSGVLSLDNQWVYKDFEYDVLGRMTRESEPYTSSASQWNTFGYDKYGRVTSQALFNGKTISSSYSNLTSTVNDGTKTVTTTTDALGNVVSVQDPGGTINYTYHANGSVKTADYEGNVVSTTIDGWGRRRSLSDPAAGNYTYSYNNYGELLTETSPKGTTTYEYDTYGKPQSKTMTGDLTDHTLTYQYDNATKLIDSITGQDNTNNRAYTYQYTYDAYKRPSIITEHTALAEFEQRYMYDTYGRVEKETQTAKNLSNAVSSTITTRNVYDTSGILSEIWNDGTPDKLWELDAITARGQALNINLGNGIEKSKTYDPYGYLETIEDTKAGASPTVALHTSYDFDQQLGRLNNRTNLGFNHQESFGYDNLDRLTTISGAVTKTMAYDARGRITNNTDLGEYAYDSNSKYRLKKITPNTAGNTYFQAHPTQQISYNAFKKPIEIHEAEQGRVSFEYGPMMNRSHAYYGGENADKLLRRYRKHYSAITGTEIVEDTQTGSTKIVTYINGDAYTAPLAHIKRTVDSPINAYHYLHRDYLGSILAISDANGNVKEERQFGAWGTLDTFLDSSGGTTFDHQSLLGRGYTGHEHFFGVSLIHMNGRMYDAQLGRFLSPDNYIQQPFNTQNYNRYGYVLNNPLMYTDSSGEFIEYIFAAAVALITGNAIFGNHDATPYDNTYENGGAQSAAPTNNYNNLQSTSSIATKPEIVRPVENFDHPSLQYNPVYGSNGEGFLGTTESGLQGEAIIMDAANFTQGMSDTSALGMGTLFSDFSGSENAMNFIQSHFSNLSNRPDSDGKLTFAEVTKWSNEGSGQPLFVDARKINLNSINTGDFTQNSSTYIDFFGSKNFHPETGPVYGTIKVTLLNPNDGTIKLGARSSLLDVHDFKNSLFSKINDYLYPGNPADFDIYCAPCTTRIKTTAEVNQYWNQIYKVMGERPKF